MSYWIYLQDRDGLPCRTERFQLGGTYAAEGSTECELNVTYNYAKLFNFRELDGKTGQETATLLRETAQKYGTRKSDDYWECTEGNVGATLAVLAAWAAQYPEATWDVH